MKFIKYTCFSILSLALLTACSMKQSSETSMNNMNNQTTTNTTTSKHPLVGTEASDFELKDMKGNTVKLSDYKGKKVYLKFWATWCGPCRMVGPIISELAKDYDGKLVVGKCDVEENDEIAAAYGVRNIPTILFFKNGELVDKFVGAANKNIIEEKFKTLL